MRHTLELTPINSFDTPTFNCASGIDEITSGTICSLVKLSITPFQTSRIILQRKCQSNGVMCIFGSNLPLVN